MAHITTHGAHRREGAGVAVRVRGMTVGVLDFGVGNVGSILSMHRKLTLPAARVTVPDELPGHDRYILPGVGAFDDAMSRLRASCLDAPLRELVVEDGRPLLGICLGMQLLADSSDEGGRSVAGLGWIPGLVRSMRGRVPPGMRLPFMGWGFIDRITPHALFSPTEEPQRYYFVHSLAFWPDDEDDLLATVDYGVDVPAVVGRGHIVGTQFHPEKSHRYGMRVLEAFAALPAGR